jgi:hypothetical protein
MPRALTFSWARLSWSAVMKIWSLSAKRSGG